MQDQAGGLVGAVKGVRMPRVDPLKVIVALVVSAGVILIARKAGFKFEWANAAVALTLGLAALCGEFYFSGEVVRSWVERSVPSLCAFALLWACAFGYSVNQWLGAASDGQFEKAAIQKSAFIQTQDLGAAEKELAADVRRLQEKLTASPTRTPEAADAYIRNAEAHRWFEKTEKCTKTMGPQTRDFCDGYASAVADKSMAANALVLREELKMKMADLKSVRAERKGAPVTTTDERTDLRMYTRYVGLSQETAMDVQAGGTILFISVVISGLGMLEAARRYRGMPRPSWPWTRAIRRLLYGRNDPSVTVIERERTVTDAPLARRIAARLASEPLLA